MLYVADVYENRTEMTDAPIVVLVHDLTCYTIYASNHHDIRRWYCSSISVWWYLIKVLVHLLTFLAGKQANYCAHKTFFSCLRLARSKISHSKLSESIWIFDFFLSKYGLMQVVMYSAYRFRV